ncbi:thyroid receptor-interacting protein 11 isoform X4 [Cryptotermes secundus]|nr:thyroid receptor-interacting protein 11 isoform X4 [Cryptotermes secundus]XP_033611718.1 thyroid receptor-interacting protein 11 isoform X4 [Cryptotermes secundus]
MSNSPESFLDVLQSAKDELREKSKLLVVFTEELENLKTEKQQVSSRCVYLEKQVQKLSEQLENESEKRTGSELSELEQLRSQLRAATDQLAQTRDENTGVLREQLNAAEHRIEELEKELLKVHQQMLDHLSDSQVNTSEIRGEVEQTRWQLLQESGVQKTELLRARQDMVNRIIQMGEKVQCCITSLNNSILVSREVEMNMKKLQLDGKHLTADIMAIIHKLGDPEQQELIHGVLKALELENQVLKLRNAQLELAGNTETLKGNSCDFSSRVDFHCGDDGKKSIGGDSMDLNLKYSDSSSKKTDDDCETESLKSEISELCLLKQKLNSQISQLQMKVETYERDIECFEMMKSDWTVEKKMLEQHLSGLKEQLREKEEKLNLVTAQKGLMEVKKQSLVHVVKSEEHVMLQKRLEELSVQLTQIQEEKEQLQQGKICLSSEVEAMAKVIQDLESQLARAQEENTGLTKSLEVLDEQHQGAIDQLLKVKQSLLKQNKTLQSELETMKQISGFEKYRYTLRSESFEKIDAGTDCFSPACMCREVQTEPCNDIENSDEVYAKCRRNLEIEFQEKILKLITFEIPKDYFSVNSNSKDDIMPMGMVEALVRMCVECKWQRDTLERKVAELVKELQDTKHMYEDRNKAAHELDSECRILKGNIETLIEELMVSKNGGGEGLAPIPENNETEAMEQKIMMLENEIEVLREARLNLEVDAKGLREEVETLVKKLQTANAMLRNQENLETESNRWQEAATSAGGQLKEALAVKCSLEEEVEGLRGELQKLEAMNKDQVSSSEKILEELQEEIAELQERLLQQEELQNQKEALMNTVTYTQDQLELSNMDRSKLKDEVEELQKQIEGLKAMGNLQTEVASLQQQLSETRHVEEQLRGKTRQLEQAALKISEYEHHSKDLNQQLKNCKEDLEALKCKLNDTEAQLNEVLNTKSLMQKELGHIQEEFNLRLKEISKLKEEKSLIEQNLMHVVSDKSNAECEYEGILSDLHNKDIEMENLKKVNLELEQEVERLYLARAEMECKERSLQATGMEVERWKEMAKASERQLNEALRVRDELEQECKRLYLIETRVQNQEHLEREVEQLKKLSEGIEQNSNQLLSDKLSLEKQCSYMRNQLCDLEDMEKDAKERADSVEQQLNDALHDNAERERKIQMMHTIEEKFKNLEKDFVRQKELSFSLQQELSEVALSKCELEAECKRLLAMEGKLRNQETLELELKELRQKLAAVEQELNEAVLAKLQLRDDYKKMDSASKLLKSEVSTQKEEREGHEECETLDSHEVLKAVEEQLQSLQREQQKIVDDLGEKTCENDKTENSLFLQMISEQKSHSPECEEKYQFESNDAIEMAKETIANLSTIIKDKDAEIDALNKKLESFQHLHDIHSVNEEFIKFREAVSEQLTRLNKERTELITTVQVKHQESVQYHNEIQRLTGVLDQEMKKLEEMKCQHANLTQQYEEKEKMVLKMQNDFAAALLRIQQLEKGWVQFSSLNESGKGSNAEFTQMTSELIQLHAQEQQAKENQIQMLHSQVADLENHLLLMSEQKHAEGVSPQNKAVNVDVSLPEDLRMQLETLQAECKRMADSLLQEQTRNKYLQNEVHEQCEKESVLLKQLDRLRLHLVAVEESYTQEALKAEEQVKDLQNKLVLAEERIKNSSTAYTSASIRANQHVESLQGQARLIAQQRDDLQLKLSAAEDQIHHHSAALRNLQIVLEQFQKDKEREIDSATERLQQQLQGAQELHDELCAEIAVLKVQLAEAKEGLSAAARLGEQLDKKSETIAGLREEVTRLSSQLQESETKVQSASLNMEGKVDRHLLKNLVLGYFVAPPNTRNQVLRIVTTVLDFNQEERARVGLESGTSPSGWFRSFLQPGKGPSNMQSLSEAFVQFLENESRPHPQLRLLPEAQEAPQGDSRSDSPSSSTGGSQRRSPLLLSEVHLPTFTQFPVGRNSSSILKDVLKDS